MDNERLVKLMTIDNRLESYNSFFDHGWSKRLMRATGETALESIVFDLCVEWRGIANTAAMPHITFEMFKTFSEGFARTPEPYGKKWISFTREHLVRRLGDNGLTQTKKQLLQKILDELYAETNATLEKCPWTVDLQELWDDLREKYEMQVAIWGSQRLAYGALYYAYEDFIKRTVRTIPDSETLPLGRAPEIGTAIEQLLGANARDYCWSHPDIVAARNVRHALVHNGGRLTKSLSNIRHTLRIKIQGDNLHIMAPDTTSLHDALKARVEYLVELALRPAIV